jgi:membrane protease YdiL (CAAX protease family)
VTIFDGILPSVLGEARQPAARPEGIVMTVPITRERPAWLRLVLLLVIFFAVDYGVVTTLTAVAGNATVSLLLGVVAAGLTLALYTYASRKIERRVVDELPRRPRAVGQGVLLGIGLFTATMLIIGVLGGFRLAGWGSFGGFVSAAGLMIAVAVAEEVLFRGVLFRIVEEWTGTWGALAISAVLFGALHLLNPGATIGGALAVMVAGSMLAAAYVATRALWLPIGLHFGWNFAETGIFSATVSGSDGTRVGLLRSAFDGPAILTGGGFGPEASIVAVLVCAVPIVLLLRLAHRRGHLRARPTRRAGQQTTA